MLVDSWASVSVIPAPPSTYGSGVHLVTADGASLTCFGFRIIPQWLGSHRFDWPFQLAPMALPILGADFLKHHRLLLDVSNQRVFCPASPGSPEISLVALAPSMTSGLHATLLSTPQCISDLLFEFPDVLSSDGFTASKPQHQIRHHLLTQPGPRCLLSLFAWIWRRWFRKSRILHHGEHWNHTLLYVSLVFSSLHGL